MFLMINMTSVFTVLFLVFLEGILSVDNALVLAMMVRTLPENRRSKALVYGIWGAFLFRALALFFLSWLIQISWIKFVGGGYLIGMSISHFFFDSKEENSVGSSSFTFWRVVLMIELMDISFSADSILASLSVSSSYWILLTGGILGIAMMRFAAQAFVWMVDRYPRMETTAYLLVLIMGAKLIAQGFNRFDFHSVESPMAWSFWGVMAFSIFYGLTRKQTLDAL